MNMKKITAVLVCAGLAAAFAQQPAEPEPVYVNGIFIGAYACEFAENGAKDPEIKELEPFIKNGRLYFLGVGQPISKGNLKTGFEFLLSESHKIHGIYNGKQTDAINSTEWFGVAGYAEKGKVVITHFFFDEAAIDTWSKNVKLAFNYQ